MDACLGRCLPVSKRTGLPEKVALKPRESHYVAGLAPDEPQVRHRMIPTAQIHPNPDQPRQRIGALEPLATSIRDQGILQPILVRRLGPKDFQIIAGERRYRAAVLAGLREVPCVEREAAPGDALELALVETCCGTISPRSKRPPRTRGSSGSMDTPTTRLPAGSARGVPPSPRPWPC